MPSSVVSSATEAAPRTSVAVAGRVLASEAAPAAPDADFLAGAGGDGCDGGGGGGGGGCRWAEESRWLLSACMHAEKAKELGAARLLLNRPGG